MYIANIKLHGIRSFEEVDISLAERINVFVGANNSGKSTLLKSVLGLQYYPPYDIASDLRQPHSIRPLTEITFVESAFAMQQLGRTATLQFVWNGADIRVRELGGGDITASGGAIFPSDAPNNSIYPYISRRKAVAYSEAVNLSESLSVKDSLSNLYAKLDYVTNPDRPSYEPFMTACQEILGLRISAVASSNGKRAAYVVDNFRQIPVIAMGEGVSNILGLLVDLFLAEGKVFVIEEVENDIHPAALKQLLRLIALSAERNQFLISTHSNIVVRQLCAEPESKLFHVSMQLKERVPTSVVEEVRPEPMARRAVLEDLGYEFADFDLHAAWLFLEESSAEQIIRDYLVPWFAPKLAGRLRTFAAGGINNVEVKFNDFDRLFVFLNLESAYKNRAWVIVDSGETEAKVIESLRAKWTPKGWSTENFQQFSEHDFERYFPERFKTDIYAACSATMDKQAKRERKAALLKQVVVWIKDDATNAKIEFQTSAGDVIKRLQKIESAMT